MNMQDLKTKIITEAEELLVIVNNLSKESGQLEMLNIEAAIGKTGLIYGDLLVCKSKLSTENFSEKTKEVVAPVVEKKQYHKPEIVIEAPVQEEKAEEIEFLNNDETVVETEKKEEIVEPVKEVAAIISDEPKAEIKITEAEKEVKESLADSLLKNSNAKDFATKLQQKPISDLNEAIGLADKLLYINELFDKSTEKYNEAVHYINNCNAFEDAIFYIEHHYKWNLENETVISFMELVKRKFPQ